MNPDTKLKLQTPAQRERAMRITNQLFNQWKKKLLLHPWTLFVQEVEWTGDEGGGSQAIFAPSLRMQTTSDPNYLNAHIDVQFNSENFVRYCSLVECVVHELLHVLLSPITERYGGALETYASKEWAALKPILHGLEEGIAEMLAYVLTESSQPSERPANT